MGLIDNFMEFLYSSTKENKIKWYVYPNDNVLTAVIHLNDIDYTIKLTRSNVTPHCTLAVKDITNDDNYEFDNDLSIDTFVDKIFIHVKTTSFTSKLNFLGSFYNKFKNSLNSKDNNGE